MRARVTPLDHYERLMARGEYAVRMFDVIGAPSSEGEQAAAWWLRHVDKTWYDWRAFPWLLTKNLFQARSDLIKDWRWAYWCTEGCRAAWADGAGRDPWDNEHPTPQTTEKRAWPQVYPPPVRPPTLDPIPMPFRDVTEEVMRDPVDWRMDHDEWTPIGGS
jgi:hypothetical protein